METYDVLIRTQERDTTFFTTCDNSLDWGKYPCINIICDCQDKEGKRVLHKTEFFKIRKDVNWQIHFQVATYDRAERRREISFGLSKTEVEFLISNLKNMLEGMVERESDSYTRLKEPQSNL